MYSSKGRACLLETDPSSITTKRKNFADTTRNLQPKFQYCELVKKNMKEKFTLLHTLPFIDDLDCDAEFYFV